jgi:hypothetical protein
MAVRRRVFVAAIGCVAAGLACALVPFGTADAKTNFDSPYTLAQTFNAALRLVRVDLGLAVTEKDPGVAYVLFDYKSTESGSRVVPGSIQMLDTGKTVKVVVQLGQMPRYHEQVIVDALAKKLREEYGDPAPRNGRKDTPDAGPDGQGPGETIY